MALADWGVTMFSLLMVGSATLIVISVIVHQKAKGNPLRGQVSASANFV
jgi:hypothetical protein